MVAVDSTGKHPVATVEVGAPGYRPIWQGSGSIVTVLATMEVSKYSSADGQ